MGPKPVDHEKLAKYLAIRRQEAETSGLEDYLQLRKDWSKFLKWLLGIMIAFQILLTIAVGLNWLNFKNYQWFITAVVVETFLQIAGMCLVVVWFLFPKNK